MKRFRFNLHALWVLRGQQEELARRRFAGALRAVEAAMAAVRQARARLTEATEAFQARVADGLSAAAWQQERAWLQQLEEILHHRVQVWQAACRACDAARDQWMRARQQRETLDRYRARQWQAWQLAWLRWEQKELDELARRRPGLAGSGSLSGPQTLSRQP